MANSGSTAVRKGGRASGTAWTRRSSDDSGQGRPGDAPWFGPTGPNIERFPVSDSAPSSKYQTDASDALSHIQHSSSMELLIETAFLSELLQEMWFRRHQLVDVMHSSVDAFGYDVVLQCDDVVRHVQLKAKKKSSRTSKYAISTKLRQRPAGCVVCIVWDREDDANRMQLDYLWFGSGPHEPLPELLGAVSKHSRGNAQGVKGERASMRDLKLKDFCAVSDVAGLCDRLFGPIQAVERRRRGPESNRRER